jgi:hypothetical protein
MLRCRGGERISFKGVIQSTTAALRDLVSSDLAEPIPFVIYEWVNKDRGRLLQVVLKVEILTISAT